MIIKYGALVLLAVVVALTCVLIIQQEFELHRQAAACHARGGRVVLGIGDTIGCVRDR